MNTLFGKDYYIMVMACMVKGDKVSAEKHFDKFL